MSHPKGVTMVEVLLAVAISAIGFAAVFALQISSVQGNISAREIASAVNLAENTADMLQRESYKWVDVELPGPYLNQEPNQWHTLTPAAVDHNGRVSRKVDGELGSLLQRQRFCIHYSVTPLTDGYAGLVSGRVRVVWPFATFSEADLDEACRQDRLPDFTPKIGEWYSLTIPIVLRAGGE